MLQVALFIIGFVFCSGVLAMIDAAVLSISQAEVEEMCMKKQWGAQSLRLINQRITRAVVVIVIVTNTINVLGPILVGQKAVAVYGSTVIGVITAILTFGTIVFSEIIPKSLGAHYAPIISRVAAPVIVILIYVLYPLVLLLEYIAHWFQSGQRVIGTEEQIRSLASIGRHAGYIESDEGQLVHRAFILNDKTAQDVMTPLKDVVGVQESETMRGAANKVFKHPYSRYPIFGPSIHDVRGIVMSHDILEALSEGKDDDVVTGIMREGLVVSAGHRCDQLIVLFRDRHIHLAVVQDEGHTVGLVTLEDVLEELVGDIEDETDIERDG